MKSCEHTTSWRRLTCRLTVGWLVLVISAARLNDLVLATARKTRSSAQYCPLSSVSSSSALLLNDCCSSSKGSMVLLDNRKVAYSLAVSPGGSPPIRRSDRAGPTASEGAGDRPAIALAAVYPKWNRDYHGGGDHTCNQLSSPAR